MEKLIKPEPGFAGCAWGEPFDARKGEFLVTKIPLCEGKTKGEMKVIKILEIDRQKPKEAAGRL